MAIPHLGTPSDLVSVTSNEPLHSVHTSSFPDVLEQLRASLLVTTYQAGKLVVMRNDGGTLNTHFRNLDKPMGIALQQDRIAIGCQVDIKEFQNLPAACEVLDKSPDYPTTVARHDACFMPRTSYCTGDIEIHELLWLQDELYFVNTAFSCIAKRSADRSFVPVWSPRFVKRLLAEDCCHLNGVAARDGRLRYVTALGETSTPGGWRQNKQTGGILIDLEPDEVVARGLSMPHSPRWHDGKLWLLESGRGAIGTLDVKSGQYEVRGYLPGFTRGLAFLGQIAFIGLSKIRESSTFGELPITERLNTPEDRVCGVFLFDIVSSKIIGFCKFENGVHEIFGVEVLAGFRCPDVITHDLELISRSYFL